MGTPDGMEDLVMSDPVNVLMQDPTEPELVAALARASAQGTSASVARKRWQTQLDEVADNAEGQMAISSVTDPRGRTSHVLLAWWSDHSGGKHVRVRGGDKVNLRTHLSRLDHDERPPLWQVYPERIYRVKRGDAEARWLASCACGVTGVPREIAWMGPRCGPCHDRREEGDIGAVSEGKTILREGSVVDALAFAPNNEAVAAVIDRELLVEIGQKKGERSLFGDPSEEPRSRGIALVPLTYSPDGQWLAFGMSIAGQALLLDLRTDQLVYLSLDDNDSPQDITDIAFSPAGDHFVACDYSRQGRLFRWTGSLWAEVRSFRGATAVAISPTARGSPSGGRAVSCDSTRPTRGRNSGR